MRVVANVTIRRDLRELGRQFHNALRATLYEFGDQVYHPHWVLRHFTPSAPQRYQYQARSKAWRNRKLFWRGSTLYSGFVYSERRHAGKDLGPHLRDTVLGSHRTIARSGPKVTTLTVKMPGKFYTPKRQRDFTRPPINEELRRVTQDELAEARRFIRAGVLAKLEQNQAAVAA